MSWPHLYQRRSAESDRERFVPASSSSARRAHFARVGEHLRLSPGLPSVGLGESGWRGIYAIRRRSRVLRRSRLRTMRGAIPTARCGDCEEEGFAVNHRKTRVMRQGVAAASGRLGNQCPRQRRAAGFRPAEGHPDQLHEKRSGRPETAKIIPGSVNISRAVNDRSHWPSRSFGQTAQPDLFFRGEVHFISLFFQSGISGPRDPKTACSRRPRPH